jgi:hypothetical protein
MFTKPNAIDPFHSDFILIHRFSTISESAQHLLLSNAFFLSRLVCLPREMIITVTLFKKSMHLEIAFSRSFASIVTGRGPIPESSILATGARGTGWGLCSTIPGDVAALPNRGKH